MGGSLEHHTNIVQRFRFMNVCIFQRGVISDNNLSLLPEGRVFGSCMPISTAKGGYLLHVCLFEQTGLMYLTSGTRMNLSDTAVNHIHNFFWRNANLVVQLLQSQEERARLFLIGFFMRTVPFNTNPTRLPNHADEWPL